MLFRSAEDPVVVALPRGGVPVAAEVARMLDAPLDVLVVRKLGFPFQPELAMGAIAEGGGRVVDEQLSGRGGVTAVELDAVERRERLELERRVARYRGGRRPVPVAGRTVIVVDDGIATGATFFASVEAIRQQDPRRIVAAIPVGPAETIATARSCVDELIVLATPDPFWAVGNHYVDFTQVEDHDVLEYLNLAEQSLRERLEQASKT